MTMQTLVDKINSLTGLYDEAIRKRALDWTVRYSDAEATKVCVTGDGCILIEYNLDSLPNQCVVFEVNRLILWNVVGTVRKNYRRVKYLT